MALRSSGRPLLGVYLVIPLARASAAACLTCPGVSKSGSPAPNPITSSPWARICLARAETASVGEGAKEAARRET